MFVNEPKKIDLSKNFIDPDNNSLTFNTTSKNGLLSFRFEDKNLVISANSVGNDSYVIAANDGNGGIAKSPAVNMKILSPRFNLIEIGILNFLNAFGLLNLMLLIIIIVLFVVLMFRLIKINGEKSDNKSGLINNQKVKIFSKKLKKQK
jgi:hypothetical protein